MNAHVGTRYNLFCGFYYILTRCRKHKPNNSSKHNGTHQPGQETQPPLQTGTINQNRLVPSTRTDGSPLPYPSHGRLWFWSLYGARPYAEGHNDCPGQSYSPLVLPLGPPPLPPPLAVPPHGKLHVLMENRFVIQCSRNRKGMNIKHNKNRKEDANFASSFFVRKQNRTVNIC